MFLGGHSVIKRVCVMSGTSGMNAALKQKLNKTTN